MSAPTQSDCGLRTLLKWHLRIWELSWLDPFQLEWLLTTPNSLNQLSVHSSMRSGGHSHRLTNQKSESLRLGTMTN